MSLSVALVKFHWFGINWHVFVYYYTENRATSQILKVLPNKVFPPIWGKKMAAFWACVCKLSWTLFSPARVQPLYGAGRKESSGTGLSENLLCPDFTKNQHYLSVLFPHQSVGGIVVSGRRNNSFCLIEGTTVKTESWDVGLFHFFDFWNFLFAFPFSPFLFLLLLWLAFYYTCLQLKNF